MMLRRKLYSSMVIFIIAFLWFLASQSIQRRHPPPLLVFSPSSQVMPSMKKTVVEHTMDPVTLDTNTFLRSCGCSGSCISDLGKSDWFSQHYDPQQQPVLRVANNSFDPDALRWWLGLQQSDKDQTLEKVISKMFQVISPPTMDFRPLPSRCRSCAVVGNSGNLQQSGHGNLIDTHDLVIRMNKAVTQGFEKDVGNRTTHHFMYPESAVDINPGVSLVLLPFKQRDLEWLTSALSTGKVKMYEIQMQT